MKKLKKIVIATIKSWNIKNAKSFISKNEGKYQIKLITNKDDFKNFDYNDFSPDFIFFPHWSWKIPKKIYDKYKCIVFHCTDLPFGRGGSPVQNLISRGIYETKISAIKVVEQMDAGDIFLKKPLSLYGSSAEEIFIRMSKIIFGEMIPTILSGKIIPRPQEGKVTTFKRLKPMNSFIQNDITLEELFDKIRMLDAEGYPKAYFELENLILKFSRATLYSDGIKAEVYIKRKEENNDK